MSFLRHPLFVFSGEPPQIRRLLGDLGFFVISEKRYV